MARVGGEFGYAEIGCSHEVEKALKTQNAIQLLRAQPGFIRDFILEQSGGPGEFNFLAVAEWESEEVIGRVRAAVEAFHKQIGLDPHELVKRLGIKADIGMYRRVAE